MKRAVAVIGTAVLASVAALGVHVWSNDPGAGTTASRTPQRAARAPRAGGLADGAVAASNGTLAISGVVFGPAGPIAGVVVAAFAAYSASADPALREACAAGSSAGGSFTLPPEGEDLNPLDHCEVEEASAAFAEAFATGALERPALARATTDAEGRFTLEGLPSGRYDVWAEREGGFASAAGLEAPDEDVELDLEAGVLVHGKVTVNLAAPGEPMLVSGLAAGFPRVFETQTGAGGAFTLGPLPSTPHWIASTSLEGYLGAHAVLDEVETPVELALSAPRRVSGVVLDDGKPAAGVKLVLAMDGPKLLELESDAAGRFAFEHVRPGEYELRGNLPFAEGSLEVVVPDDRDVKDVTLDLEPTGRVRGVVLGEGGRPLTGAIVYIAGHEVVHTGPDGRFDLPGAMDDERLVARADGYIQSEEELAVPPRAALERTITLRKAFAITGWLEDENGQPIAVGRVAIREDSGAEGDAAGIEHDGSFRLETARSTAQVDVAAPGYLSVRRVMTSGVEERVVLRKGALLMVKVVDASGAPFSEASVSASLLRGDALVLDEYPLRGAYTEAGVYQVAGLAAGDYRVEARADGAADVRTIHSDGRAPARVELRMPARGTISGVVVSAAGAPLQDAYVRAIETMEKGRTRIGTPARTDEQGRFQLTVERGRRYTLSATKENRPPVEGLAALVDGAPVKIVLRESSRVRGRVLYPDGRPASVFSVNGERERTSDGRFERELEPGAASITIGAPGFAPQVKAFPAVRDAETADLGDISLSAGRTVAVRVEDARSGAPVRGASARVVGKAAGGNEDGALFQEDASRRTRTDGTTELAHVPDGALLQVEAEGYAAAVTELGHGTSALVKLEPHGSLRVFLDDPFHGPLWVSVEGGEDRTLPLDPTAGATFRSLPPGEYMLTLWTSPPVNKGPFSGALAAAQPMLVNVPAQGGAEAHLRLRSAGSDVTVQLLGGGQEWEMLVALAPSGLDIRAVGMEGLRDKVAQLVLPARPMQGRQATFTNVPDGRYQVVVVIFAFYGRGLYLEPQALELRASAGAGTGAAPRVVQVPIPDDWQPEDY